MGSTKKDFPWYIQAGLLLFPVVSVTANLVVCVVLFVISMKLRMVNFLRSTHPPPEAPPHEEIESEIFTTRLFLTSLFALVVILNRHIEIAKFYSNSAAVNKASLYFGGMFVFGKMMVDTSRTPPNRVSICLYLLGAALYGTAQVFIYYRNFVKQEKYIQSLRAVFCVGMLINIMIFGAFMKHRGIITRDNYAFESEQRVQYCVGANILFQHIWSYMMEKFYRDN